MAAPSYGQLIVAAAAVLVLLALLGIPLDLLAPGMGIGRRTAIASGVLKAVPLLAVAVWYVAARSGAFRGPADLVAFARIVLLAIPLLLAAFALDISLAVRMTRAVNARTLAEEAPARRRERGVRGRSR